MKVKVEVREDLEPDVEFYYNHQFEIYREPYLIWDRETWRSIFADCRVYQIEVSGSYAGDIILDQKGRGTTYVVDFSILPAYQRRGVGRTVLEVIRAREKRLTAVTRKETLPFFLKSGFVLNKRIRDYYDTGVDGYYVVSLIPRGPIRSVFL